MCLVTHHSDTDTIALQGVEALRKLRIKGLAAVGIDKGTVRRWVGVIVTASRVRSFVIAGVQLIGRDCPARSSQAHPRLTAIGEFDAGGLEDATDSAGRRF